MRIIDNGCIYEYKIDINKDKLTKLRDEISKEYYDVKIYSGILENCFDEKQQEDMVLRDSGGTKVLSMHSYEKSDDAFTILVLGSTYYDVTAKVIYYPELCNIITDYIEYNCKKEFLKNLFRWFYHDQDKKYFDYDKKKELFDTIKTDIHVSKKLLLDEHQVKILEMASEAGVISFDHKHLEKNKELLSPFMIKKDFKIKEKKH